YEMSQSFPTFNEAAGQDDVRTGLLNQRTRTDTLRSSFEGTSFPSSPVVGQVCWRSDTDKFYICTSISPSDNWEQILWGTPIAVADGGTGATTQSGARTALGLGTAAVLNSGTGSGDLPTITNADARYLRQSNNLSDLASASTARTNLGLGNWALKSPVTSTKTGAYSVVAGDDGKCILGNTTSAGFTITLLSAGTAGNGYFIEIKKIDSSSNILTVNGGGSNIDGSSTITLTAQYEAVGLLSNGTTWEIVFRGGANSVMANKTFALTKGGTQSGYDLGNSGTGTVTPAFANSNNQYLDVTGSFTLAAPTGSSWILLELRNDGTGGYSITLSGFDHYSGSYVNTAGAVQQVLIDCTGTAKKVNFGPVLEAA
ncbi:hypothetical protein KDA23_05230, partial [Candidatus Saccharibacteria bacterium]|nr:hypothetical protein [Candidatus Saccharibacteria bacterium]